MNVLSADRTDIFIVQREASDRPDEWDDLTSHKTEEEAVAQRDRFVELGYEGNFRPVRSMTFTVLAEI